MDISYKFLKLDRHTVFTYLGPMIFPQLKLHLPVIGPIQKTWDLDPPLYL